MPPPEGETPKLVNRPSNPIIITTEEEEDEVSEKLTAIADDEFVNGGDLGKIDNGTGHSVESREPNPSPESTHQEHAATIGKSMNNEDLHSSYLLAAPVRKGSGNMNFRHQTGNIASFVSKLSSFDFDASHSRRRGSGVLASTADLAASPEVFAQGCTLLQLCAIGNLSKVQSYVANTFNNVNFRDYDRRTGLHVASSEGHLDVVKYLISKGARVNRTDRWGGSPLDDAHRHRHTEVAKYLRAKGGRSGSLNLTSNLINAAATGDIEEVKLIMSSIDDKGVPLDMSASRRKIADSNLGLSRSKHIKGKKSNELDISEPFVFANNDVLDINKGDYDKRTALHLASSEGHYDVVEYLCKHGADVNVTDRWGGKPLDDAVQKGNERIEKLLRKYGATTAGEAAHASVRHFSMDLMKSVDSNKNSEAEHIDDDLRVDFDELEMIERIGSGAFGEIYKCRWRGILVAAKCIKASKIQKEWILKNRHMDKSSDRVANRIEMIKQASITEEEKQLALEDFRRETSIMRRLRHPNIVMMLAYSHSDDLEVMISELMKCSLLDIFKANHINNTQIPKRTQVIYAQQLAQGMNHLHKSRPPIIHRDLKPANLLIDFSGTLKIADFGLAKIRPNPEQTEQEAFMMTGETGSYRFMAPEVFRHEEYTESVDVYSYAMIFYYMLRSVAPWPGLSGVDAATKAAVDGERPLIPRDVDQRLATLLKRCWDEDPKARPSFEEIIRSLAIYSHDVFQTDDREVTLAREEASCGCVVS